MQNYPLAWPTGWPRTEPHLRRNPKFTKGTREYTNGSSWLRQREISVADGTDRVMAELRRLGVQPGDAVISTNLQTTLDGRPRSGQKKPEDVGVAVYWQRAHDHGPEARKVLAIDAYNTVEGNLAAIAATLEAMRAIERHGGARILERAFTGFTALPAPGQATSGSWRTVLGVPAEDSRLSTAEARYRTLRSKYHPDKNGGLEQPEFIAVQKAWDQACRELGNPA